MNGDVVEDVQLSIYEPPRFFESLLRGRALEEVPDITARICGICPVPRTRGDCITIVIAPLLVCFNLFIIVYVVNYIWLRQLD